MVTKYKLSHYYRLFAIGASLTSLSLISVTVLGFFVAGFSIGGLVIVASFCIMVFLASIEYYKDCFGDHYYITINSEEDSMELEASLHYEYIPEFSLKVKRIKRARILWFNIIILKYHNKLHFLFVQNKDAALFVQEARMLLKTKVTRSQKVSSETEYNVNRQKRRVG